MLLPKLDDLIDEQDSVYTHPINEHLLVVGPPGSGKTSLAVLRAQYLKNRGKKTLLITKNRMLAVLANQLGNGTVTTMTMHSFVSNHYYSLFQKQIPQHAPYHYVWPQVIQQYEDVEYGYCYDHIVVDEGQNLPAGFYQWMVRYGAPTVSVFTDENQTTDDQSSTIGHMRAASLPEEKHLYENHRNTDEIARVAEHFHRSIHLAPARVRRAFSGEIPRLETGRTWEEIATLVANRFTNRKQSVGVIVQKVDDALEVQGLLKAALPSGTRIDVYTHKTPQQAVANIKIMDEGITILTGKSAIGLEFNHVFLQDLHQSLPAQTPIQCRRLYMLCARARDTLTLVDGPQPLTPRQLADLPDSTLLTR
ncbi:AAA family ATPase [Pseudomonas sp. TE3610]